MTDDLVKQLRNSKGWPTLGNAAADRIEELEAKLAKAVGALGDIYDGEPEWPDDPEKELDWCRNRARAALAELKGSTDA